MRKSFYTSLAVLLALIVSSICFIIFGCDMFTLALLSMLTVLFSTPFWLLYWLVKGTKKERFMAVFFAIAFVSLTVWLLVAMLDV